MFVSLYIYRWRCFLSPMLITPSRAEDVVLAACALHNYLRTRLPTFTNHLLDKENENHEVIPGTWRNEEALRSIAALKGNNAMRDAKLQREYLCQYVNGVGAVSWQDRMI